MKKSAFVFAASLLAMSAASFAQAPPPSDMPVLDNAAANAKEICEAHPEQCAADKQGMEGRCKANPAGCEAAAQKVQTAEANAQKDCAANPDKCAVTKANMERRQDRRQTRRVGRQNADGTTPTN